MKKKKVESYLTIRQIQNWEKNFVKKKGIVLDEDASIKIAVYKLVEEVGEVAKALLEGNWNEIQAEISDVIIFACKIANIAEKFHGADKLTDVLRRKMKYCETRTYDKKKTKFNKPKNREFK